MADFARILAAYDSVTGEDSLTTYIAQISTSASTAIEGDTFLQTLKRHLPGEWVGSASELIDLITACEPHDVVVPNWPTTAKQVTEKLTRSAPTLRKVGWIIENLGNKNRENRTLWKIYPHES